LLRLCRANKCENERELRKIHEADSNASTRLDRNPDCAALGVVLA
jgi:hypothetical protein